MLKFISYIITILFLTAGCFHSTFGYFTVKNQTQSEIKNIKIECSNNNKNTKEIIFCCENEIKNLQNSNINEEKIKILKNKITSIYTNIFSNETLYIQRNFLNQKRIIYHYKDNYTNLIWITKSVC